MSPIIKIFKITGKFRKYYFVSGALIILVSILGLINPVLYGVIVDQILLAVNERNNDFTSIAILLGVIIISDVLITILTNIAGYIGDRLGAGLNTFLTSIFYKKLLNLQIEYFDSEVSGNISNKLQRGISNITGFISNFLNNFLPFLLTALFTVVFLAFYSIEIALVLALLFPIYIFISEKSSKAWIKKSIKINAIQDKLFGRIFESITAVRIVKSFMGERAELKNYTDKRAEIEKLTAIQSKEWHWFDIARRFVLDIVLFGIFSFIVWHTFNGRFSLGQMTILFQLVNQARFPLFAMSWILGQIQQATAGSKDFFEVLDEKVTINDKADAQVMKGIKGNIEFKNVEFHYTNSKNVLQNISLKLESGKKMAIVGESGEGKSTIINLLLRFYEPQSGEIKIDNKNINDFTQESLHKNISVVLQDSILFSGTIAENISYGIENASMDDITNAAKKANAHDFIISFEKGYESEIGERGIKLSGGQKQRIAIARAILKNAPILILDEATSSLDSKAELEVQKALNILMEGKTTIIIAHRLSTIKNVDYVIVLKKGQIVEEGKPADLINKKGIYSELINLQLTAIQIDNSEDKKLKEFNIIG